MTENTPITILLAEDDDGHARLVIKNLRRVDPGYEILRFRNGAEVLEYLLHSRPDAGPSDSPPVLILDLNMPGTDGLTVLEKLKQDDHARTIPIVVLSTTHNPAEIQRCYELGCNAFVSKPVDYTRFTKTIEKLAAFFTIVEFPGYS